MIFHTLFILVVSVSASDDQSLMQQGVGIESNALAGSVSNEWRNQVSVITEAMKEIPYPGKMRQMAIDALMKSVSQTAAPGVGATNLFKQALDLLANILADLTASKALQQVEMDARHWAEVQCNTDFGVTHSLTAKEQSMNTAHGAHETCREQQNTAMTTRATDCTTIFAMLYENFCIKPDWLASSEAKFQGGGCSNTCLGHFPEVANTIPATAKWTLADHLVDDKVDQGKKPGTTHIVAQVATWKNTAQSAKSWIDAENGKWVANAADCNTAGDAESVKRQDCNNKRTEYEEKHCQWWESLANTCTELNLCFHDAGADFESASPAIWTEGNFRIYTVAVIKRIICLIEGLIGIPVYTTDLARCNFGPGTAAYDDIVTEYNLTHPVPVTPTSCTKPTETISGQPGWYDLKYAGKAWETNLITAYKTATNYNNVAYFWNDPTSDATAEAHHNCVITLSPDHTDPDFSAPGDQSGGPA